MALFHGMHILGDGVDIRVVGCSVSVGVVRCDLAETHMVLRRARTTTRSWTLWRICACTTVQIARYASIAHASCMRMLFMKVLRDTDGARTRDTQEVNTRTAERMVLAQLEVYKEPGVNVFTEDRDFMYVSNVLLYGSGVGAMCVRACGGSLNLLGTAFQ